MKENIISTISPQLIEQAMDYASYRALIDQLLAEGKTTGPTQSEDLTHYASLNVQRMKRLDKTSRLIPELQAAIEALNRKQIWLVLTEGWCGDAAQIVPIFQKIAAASSHITLRFILRDDNLEVMDQFLTNGGRAIPKLIVLDAESLEVLADWGPRPSELQEKYLAERAAPNADWEILKIMLHKWYAVDKTQSTQHELAALIR